MSSEYTMLLYAAILLFLHNMMPVIWGTTVKGPLWSFGNRDDTPTHESWGTRARRAGANYLENLPMFVILMILLILGKQGNATSAMGAKLFLGCRVLYLFVYMAGIPYLRTLLWGTSIAGLVMMASPLL